MDYFLQRQRTNFAGTSTKTFLCPIFVISDLVISGVDYILFCMLDFHFILIVIVHMFIYFFKILVLIVEQSTLCTCIALYVAGMSLHITCPIIFVHIYFYDKTPNLGAYELFLSYSQRAFALLGAFPVSFGFSAVLHQ